MLLPGIKPKFSNLLTRSKFESKLPRGMLPGNLTPWEEHTPRESICGRSILLGSRLPGSMLLLVVQLSRSMLLRGV